MAANLDIEKLFLRLFMFSHKISLPVVRTFFVSSVLSQSPYNSDIVTFFEHHKHELFHLMGDYKCCECTLLPPLQTVPCLTRLGKDQFKKLYDTGLSHPGHFSKGSGGRVFQQCMCCISVKKDTNPKTYDITLLLTILHNCGQLSDNHKLWLDTIRKCRNRLCHLNEITDLTENEIHSLWGNLECSILQLAEEIPPKPNYKDSIETQIEILKDADYSWNTVTPIMEAMKSEINNNINGIIQNQIIADKDLKCLTTNVELLAKNCKKDNTNMVEHVSASAMAILCTQNDKFDHLSAQVAQYHIKDVDHQKKVSGTLEHAMQKLNFVVDIVNKSQCKENGESSQKNELCEKNRTTEVQNSGGDSETVPCKLRWKIETPGHLEHKKADIVKVLKKAFDIVKIGTSHEIEDVYEGSITIDTLLPMSILQDKEAFHHSIRKFLTTIVSICGIDTTIPLEVKVQITLSDLDQGSIKYSIEELKHTTMINKAVQAVPTMLDRSTESRELEIKENSEKPDSIKRAMDEIMIYSVNIKDNVVIPPSEMAFLQKRYDDFRTYEDVLCMLLMGCSNDIRWIESVLTFVEGVTPICQIEYKEKSKKLLNSENINTFIYIASKSSQRSHNLKSMLECLSESKSFLNKVITVVRDDVVISDILKESKQIRVKIKEKDWLPDLMDAIASSGAILYSVTRLSHDFMFWIPEKIVLILGNFKNVEMINSILSEYSKHKMHIQKYEIRLRITSLVLRNIQRLTGIIYVISEDLKEYFSFHPDIIQLKKRAKNELAVLINHMTLPKILKGIKKIDANDNNGDWIPNLIDEMQIMNSMVYTIRFKEKNTYGFPSMSHYGLETGLFGLIGNTKDVQWFFSALSESEKVELSMVGLMFMPHWSFSEEMLKGLICITGEHLETYLNQLVHITAFKAEEIVTITRDEMTVPDMLKGTNLVDARGTDCKWISDLIECLHRLMSIVYILRFNNDKSLYDHPRYELSRMWTTFNDYYEDNDNDGLILLMGNREEAQQFYTALSNSEIAKGSKLVLQCVPARQVHKNTIKSIICIVAKSSKDEDFSSFLQIENLECWPNNVVTLVREQTVVPNLLQKTKQIVDTGQDEMWLSDVMDEINKTMSMVYALKIHGSHPTHLYTCKSYGAKLILIIGSFKDIQWFHSTLSKSSIIQRRTLMHLHSEHISSTTIQSIICIFGKTSSEDFLQNLNIQNYKCWPNNVLTVVRDTIRVPTLMEGTHKIVVADRDEKWLSDVLHVIDRTSLTQTVDVIPHFHKVKGSTEWKSALRKRDEITQGCENCSLVGDVKSDASCREKATL